MSCQHEQFSANVNVNRLEDSGRFHADVTIKCVQCGEPFVFVGVVTGLLNDGPSRSFDGTELRIPIQPQSQCEGPPSSMPWFTIKRGK